MSSPHTGRETWGSDVRLPEARRRVLIADDHPLSREGLRMLLDRLVGLEVVAEADSGQSALSLCAQFTPDVVFLDIVMPGMDGIECAGRIRARHPDTRVIVMSALEDEATVMRALAAGASGYVSKASGRPEIEAALRALDEGEVHVDRIVAGRLLKRLSAPAPPDAQPPGGSPTQRELEVLALLGDGLTSAGIARRLAISERTVHSHIANLYRKLGVNNRVSALREALRFGLLDGG